MASASPRPARVAGADAKGLAKIAEQSPRSRPRHGHPHYGGAKSVDEGFPNVGNGYSPVTGWLTTLPALTVQGMISALFIERAT